MRGSRFCRIALFVAAVLTAGSVSACSSNSATAGSNTGSGPELTHITVGALEIPDAVTLQIAQKQGLFKQQGISVHIETLSASEGTTPALLAHTLQITSENYVGLYAQEAQTPALQMRVIADDVQAAPGVYELMVPKNSPITSPAQLKGKKIAFPGLGDGIGELATDALLNAYHVGPNAYTQVGVAFPDMPAALERGEIDAAWVTEPFITILEAAGAHVLADTMVGPMNEFPISCWATTSFFAQHYPKTVAAFTRAIVKAQQIAASNPTLVRKLLPTYIQGLSPKIANVMALATFNTTLSLTRMERVANVENEYFHNLGGSFNVKAMYDPSASTP